MTVEECFNKMLTKDNSDILNQIYALLYDFFGRLIQIMTSGIENWQDEFIWEKDKLAFERNTESQTDDFAHVGRTIIEGEKYQEIFNVNRIADVTPEMIESADLIKRTDLAGRLNLIETRLLRDRRIALNGGHLDRNGVRVNLGRLIDQARELRNDRAHWSIDDNSEFTDNDIKNYLIQMGDLLEASCSAAGIRFEQNTWNELKTAITDFKTTWDCFTSAFIKYREGDIIKKEPGTPGFMDLYHYHIIIGFSAFNNKHCGEYLTLLATQLNAAGKHFFVDKETDAWLASEMVTLRKRISERQDRNEPYDDLSGKRQALATINKNLDNWKHRNVVVVFNIPPNTPSPEYGIVEFLKKQNQETNNKWCMITDNALIAHDVWEINPDKIIAARISAKDKISVFVEEPEDLEFEGLPEQIIQPEKVHPEKARPVKPITERQMPQTHTRIVCTDSNDDEFESTLGKLIKSGGEGKIYAIEEDGSRYIKIYRADRINATRTAKLQRMLEIQDDVVNILGDSVCWPVNAVYDMGKRHLIGFTMPIAGYAEELAGTSLLGSVEEVLLSLEDAADKKLDRKDLVQICINISDLFQKLHKLSGILMGDINPGNILVDKDMNVYFNDVDSYQIEDYACPVGIPDYASPGLLERGMNSNRTLEDEEYAETVLYFYILFRKEYPLDGSRKYRYAKGQAQRHNFIWQNLTGKIQDMFEDVFVNDARYTDREWSEALRGQRNGIEEKRYSNELRPSDVIKNENETWTNFTCITCGKKFLKIIRPHEKTEDKMCPDCRRIRAVAAKRIYRVRCVSCGKPWTINLWDADGADPKNIKCPDCNPDFRYHDRPKMIDEKEIEKKGYWALDKMEKSTNGKIPY